MQLCLIIIMIMNLFIVETYYNSHLRNQSLWSCIFQLSRQYFCYPFFSLHYVLIEWSWLDEVFKTYKTGLDIQGILLCIFVLEQFLFLHMFTVMLGFHLNKGFIYQFHTHINLHQNTSTLWQKRMNLAFPVNIPKNDEK